MFIQVCMLLVFMNGLQSIEGATSKRSPDDLPIKYPGPIKNIINKNGEADIPDSCKGQTFCTVKPPDYPEAHFNKMFKGYKPMVQPTLVEVPDLGNRQGDPEETDNCATQVTYEPLYKIRTTTGDWRTVVQAPSENYVQKVRIEKCVNLGGSCFTIFPSIPDIKTRCVEKVVTWQVLVSDGKNGTETVNAEIPVCCSCHYTTNDFADRFGRPNKTSPAKV